MISTEKSLKNTLSSKKLPSVFPYKAVSKKNGRNFKFLNIVTQIKILHRITINGHSRKDMPIYFLSYRDLIFDVWYINNWGFRSEAWLGKNSSNTGIEMYSA